MWLLMLALVAAAVFYAYNIRGDIKIAPKSGGCGSCPKNNEDQKTKID